MSNRFSAAKGIRTALMGGTCLLVLAAPAVAQSSNNQVESVTVTGLISSLQQNLDIKRDANGLVDAISAEDMGKFPDVDMAAALQRIPGVTVSQAPSTLGGVTTTTGAATEITVRGFGPTFNTTLYDGRQVPSGAGQAFDFSSVGADFISQVDVMKSPDASLSSGAIGATINIKFPTPFANPGLHLTGSVSTTYSPEAGNANPNFNALFSDTFAHDTIGVLVDAAFNQNRVRADHMDIQGWIGAHLDPCQLAGAATACASTLTPSTAPAWFIQDYGLYQETTQTTREQGRLALQWKPTENLQVTLDDNYSRAAIHALQYGYSVWFNGGSLRNVTQAPDGTVTNFIQAGSPTDFQSQINGSLLQNNDTGLNVKWNATNKLAFNFDYDHSQAWLNPGGKLNSMDSDVGYGPSTPGGTNGTTFGIDVPGGNNLPYPTSYGPNNNTAAFINNGLIGSHVFPMENDERFDRVQQFKAEASWAENDRLKITVGYQYVGDHDDNEQISDFANNQWQAYAGYGPASNNNGTHGAALPQNLFTQSFSTANFINGFGGSGIPPNILVFNSQSVLNYLQGLGNPQTTNIPGFNTGCCTPAYTGVYTMSTVVGSYSQVVQNTNAGYLTVTQDTTIGGMPLRINAGVRDEYTDMTTIGIATQLTGLTVSPSDHTNLNESFSPVLTPVTGTNSYNYLLPNLDLNLGVTDDLQVRFDASRTLTRPPLGDINPVLNVGTGQRVGALKASGGNPNLMPYLSDNVDLSAEWYYQTNSYLSVDVFNKTVNNFVVQGTTQQTINGVIDPTTGVPGVFAVSTNVNGPTANVYGAEFAVQHVFGESGFGIQANATLVGTNKPYNPKNLTVGEFGMPGLADSANLIAFYDKDGFQARIAANWRDTYLDHFGQQQGSGLFGTEPTFVDAATHIDFSTSYDITPQINVYFSALNLTDQAYATHGRFSEQLLDVVDYGRQFTAGFHFKLD